MIKADNIAASASLRLIDAVFLLSLAYKLQNPVANRKREPMFEEMSQILLTNKKPEKITNYTRLTLLCQPIFRI
jgi:hypothetical protein